MNEYHKIDTVYKRDPETKFKTLLYDEYSNDAFKYLRDNEWVWTEKVDGTNIRIRIQNDIRVDRDESDKQVIGHVQGFSIGGKTDSASIPVFLLDKLMAEFTPLTDQLMDIFPKGGCLYGEGYGARIQKGGGNYISDGVDFVLFDIKVGDWWLRREDVEGIAETLGLRVVPIVGRGTLDEMVDTARAGFRSTWGDFDAEGLVARPAVELKDRAGRRVITKIKYRDFK